MKLSKLISLEEPTWQQQARSMTAGQFNHVRKILGLNKSQAARFLGVSLPTIQRYSRGNYPVPTAIGLLLTMLADLAIDPVVPRKPRRSRAGALNKGGPYPDSPQSVKRTSEPPKPGN